MNKTIQYFTPEYLAQCRHMTPLQILTFLEEFRLLMAAVEQAKENRPNCSLTLPSEKRMESI